jgi:hypothetical protein
MPPLSLAAWQIGLGCLPVAAVGIAVEQPQLAALSLSAGRRCSIDADPFCRDRLLVCGVGTATGDCLDRNLAGACDRVCCGRDAA